MSDCCMRCNKTLPRKKCQIRNQEDKKENKYLKDTGDLTRKIASRDGGIRGRARVCKFMVRGNGSAKARDVGFGSTSRRGRRSGRAAGPSDFGRGHRWRRRLRLAFTSRTGGGRSGASGGSTGTGMTARSGGCTLGDRPRQDRRLYNARSSRAGPKSRIRKGWLGSCCRGRGGARRV